MADITIPAEAVEAGARAIFKVKNPDLEWENCAAEIGSAYAQAQRNQARACFLAMIEAWPGMSQLQENDSASIREFACIILPLNKVSTQEKTNG